MWIETKLSVKMFPGIPGIQPYSVIVMTDIIKTAQLEKFVDRTKKYPLPLPVELQPFYCYPLDSGHSIIVVLENEWKPGEPLEDYLVPAPVKTVLRNGYRIRDGYAWCIIEYDRDTGLVIPDEDDEF